jgi:hypothetical protein
VFDSTSTAGARASDAAMLLEWQKNSNVIGPKQSFESQSEGNQEVVLSRVK